MSFTKTLLSYLAATLLVVSTQVGANQEALSFRVNSLGQIEAVVSGVVTCGYFGLQGVDTIDVGSSTISINSVQQAVSGGCPVVPPPPVSYKVVAVLPTLPGQVFAVNWTYSLVSAANPKFPLASAVLDVNAIYASAIPNASAIPTMSVTGGAILALLLSTVGWFSLRRRHGQKPEST